MTYYTTHHSVLCIASNISGHLEALTRPHLIGDYPSGLQKNKQQKQWTLALKQKRCDPIPGNEI